MGLRGGNKGSRSSNITDRVEFGVHPPPPPPGDEPELELCLRDRVPTPAAEVPDPPAA